MRKIFFICSLFASSAGIFPMEKSLHQKVTGEKIKNWTMPLSLALGQALKREGETIIDSDGETRLMNAIMYDSELAATYLNAGTNPNQTDCVQKSPLILACSLGREKLIAQLIEQGAHINHRSSTGQTPLIEAAKNGYMPIVQTLLYHTADIQHTDIRGLNALAHATANGKTEAARLLLDLTPSPNYTFLLKLAIIAENSDLISLYLDRGGDLTEAQETDIKNTPLREFVVKVHFFQHQIRHKTLGAGGVLQYKIVGLVQVEGYQDQAKRIGRCLRVLIKSLCDRGSLFTARRIAQILVAEKLELENFFEVASWYCDINTRFFQVLQAEFNVINIKRRELYNALS